MKKISKPLLDWYYDHARTLPWRVIGQKHPTPYFVWVSEIMLQQTTVQTVIPYFERFIQHFPTVDSLAQAQEDEVLHLWQGLGYYSRARNLHAGAKQIVERGSFPDTFESLQTIKGIGSYTAAAIASIAFDEKVPVVDGNVKRVFSRLFCVSSTGKDLEKKAFNLSLKEMDEQNCGDYNSAVMDLGATICIPKNPRCLLCPLQQKCDAFQQKKVDHFPVIPPKKKTPIRYGVIQLIESKNGIPIRKREEGILKGLYELPWDEVEKKDYDALSSDFIKHTFTHFHLYLKIQKSTEKIEGLSVLKDQLLDYPFSTLMKKALTKFQLISKT